MYQWVNPTTGHSQMSGKPPAWYRGEMGGPRVLVFERNVLVDDTAVAVSEEQRLQLRGEALHIEPTETEKALSAKQAVATLEAQIQAIVDSPAMEEYLKSPPVTAVVDADPVRRSIDDKPTMDTTSGRVDQKKKPVRESADERVERLKALISAWDKNKTEEAKLLLDPNVSSHNYEQSRPQQKEIIGRRLITGKTEYTSEQKKHTTDSVLKEFGFKNIKDFREWYNEQ